MRRFLLILLLISIFSTFPNTSLAANIDRPAKIFETNCAGCHPHGGNIIRRGKNLSLRALHRNKLDSLEAIAVLVTDGKNNMPAYQDRLTEKEIKELSSYVLEKAKTGWK